MMRSFSSLCSLSLLLASHVSALYLYMDADKSKCFYEELPKDTLVVGHYSAAIWDDNSRSYQPNPNVGMIFTVDEIFDNNHRIVTQRGASQGKLTFTAADAGDHRLCFTPVNVPHTKGYLFSGSQAGALKLELDLVIGETSKIEASDKPRMDEMVQKVRDLNARLQDVRREQVFQREREAEFRDQSEAVNSHIVRWTVIQLLVLIATCAWQLSYLRNFFIKSKLT